MLVIVLLSILITSCKPKVINGQILISTESGIAIPLNNIEVCLVDAKEADDFIKSKQQNAASEFKSLKHELGDATEQMILAQNYAELVKSTNDTYIKSNAFTNDSRYLDLVNQTNTLCRTISTFLRAVDYLKSQYGVPPNPRTRLYSQEQTSAWNAELGDLASITDWQAEEARTEIDMMNLGDKIIRERQIETQSAQAKADNATQNMNSVSRELSILTTASYYLDDFSPTKIAVSLTDERGNFSLPDKRKDVKIFAKLKSDESGLDYFWLLDPPKSNQQFILNDSNKFQPPPVE